MGHPGDPRNGQLGELLEGVGDTVMDRLGVETLAPDVRAGVTGAFAGLASELVVSGVFQDPIHGEDLREASLRGAALGMIYARLIERWLPGPFWLRGAILGLATHTTRAWGGLPRLLGPLSPHRRIPLIGDRFESDRAESDALWEHVLFGIALAAFYSSKRESNGTSSDV